MTISSALLKQIQHSTIILKCLPSKNDIGPTGLGPQTRSAVGFAIQLHFRHIFHLVHRLNTESVDVECVVSQRRKVVGWLHARYGLVITGLKPSSPSERVRDRLIEIG